MGIQERVQQRFTGTSVGASVLVPVSRQSRFMEESLESICRSVEKFSGAKELVLCQDVSVSNNANLKIYGFLERLSKNFSFVRLIQNPGATGMRPTRIHAIQSAKYETLIFTDDDCVVELEWVTQIYERVQKLGVVTGPIESIERGHPKEGVYSRLESLIDQYRAHARTRGGMAKFVSFPNLGIQKNLLPETPFDSSSSLYGNDMDLGCRLRVRGVQIHVAEDLVVRTEYPKSLIHVLRRKLAHAQGIAYVQRRMGPKRWKELEIGTHGKILKRWVGISLCAPVPLREKLVFLVMNMTYCLGLMFYFHVMLRSVPMIDDLSPVQYA